LDRSGSGNPSYKISYNMVLNFDQGSGGAGDTHVMTHPVAAIDHSLIGHMRYDEELSGANYLEGAKEYEFDPMFWASQYDRHVQVLDTDHFNYVVLYHCLESARFWHKKRKQYIEPKEVWDKVTKANIDFSKHPFIKYNIPEKLI